MALIMMNSYMFGLWHGASHTEPVQLGQVTCRHWAHQGNLHLGLSMALIMMNSYTMAR